MLSPFGNVWKKTLSVFTHLFGSREETLSFTENQVCLLYSESINITWSTRSQKWRLNKQVWSAHIHWESSADLWGHWGWKTCRRTCCTVDLCTLKPNSLFFFPESSVLCLLLAFSLFLLQLLCGCLSEEEGNGGCVKGLRHLKVSPHPTWNLTR